jgi:hypothetical protein
LPVARPAASLALPETFCVAFLALSMPLILHPSYARTHRCEPPPQRVSGLRQRQTRLTGVGRLLSATLSDSRFAEDRGGAASVRRGVRHGIYGGAYSRAASSAVRRLPGAAVGIASTASHCRLRRLPQSDSPGSRLAMAARVGQVTIDAGVGARGVAAVGLTPRGKRDVPSDSVDSGQAALRRKCLRRRYRTSYVLSYTRFRSCRQMAGSVEYTSRVRWTQSVELPRATPHSARSRLVLSTGGTTKPQDSHNGRQQL